jgi:hypothetical protein
MRIPGLLIWLAVFQNYNCPCSAEVPTELLPLSEGPLLIVCILCFCGFVFLVERKRAICKFYFTVYVPTMSLFSTLFYSRLFTNLHLLRR